MADLVVVMALKAAVVTVWAIGKETWDARKARRPVFTPQETIDGGLLVAEVNARSKRTEKPLLLPDLRAKEPRRVRPIHKG